MREKNAIVSNWGPVVVYTRDFLGLGWERRKKCEIVRDSNAELSSSIHMYFGVSVKFTSRGDINFGLVKFFMGLSRVLIWRQLISS